MGHRTCTRVKILNSEFVIQHSKLDHSSDLTHSSASSQGSEDLIFALKKGFLEAGGIFALPAFADDGHSL